MCQRKPACYRLNSPFYLRIRYRLALLRWTFLFPQLVLVHFTNHYHFFRHPPPPWILDGLLTYWSHWRVDICIAHTQNGSTCCAFLQWEWHKIINRSLFFDSWHVILLANASQLHFYRSFSGGRLCFFLSFPPRCQHSATGVVSREGGMGEGLWHKAGGPLPAYLLLPAASSKLTAKSSARTHPLSAIGHEYPVTSGWWTDVNILLMFHLLICSLTHHHITANGRFTKEWNSSSESHWLTEAEQVDGEIERTSGMWRRKGTPNVRLWKERERRGLLYASCYREENEALSARRRSRRRHQQRRDGWMGAWSVAGWS